ncbi:hypothetical protein tinsulaeT_38760 [Thalassotalea insulae]|uniref:Uncharacterized protein n=2 Tax=Thalassotalea insulae TaxID=2056778 RepID=A0ABQ6GMT9_9GAMM|nr:hypothetical protein [Thalassotalea insulae]GLX76687.1 hypothetical protein tinsulaeT_00270 [Thalassotalea insulae]GLX80536.1 hypothetical protein tinsulaeT_38760 [Thalassotalea insulae]
MSFRVIIGFTFLLFFLHLAIGVIFSYAQSLEEYSKYVSYFVSFTIFLFLGKKLDKPFAGSAIVYVLNFAIGLLAMYLIIGLVHYPKGWAYDLILELIIIITAVFIGAKNRSGHKAI